MHRRIYLTALAVFVLGEIAGGAIFFLASSDGSFGSNYQIIGDQVYSTDPSDSKAYNDQLERMGGRSAVFADQFSHWFASLWQGQNLGITIAILAAVLALFLLWVGREIERDHQFRNASRSTSASES